MKSRDSLLRLKRFHADDRRRRVAQIEAMMAEFLRMAADLDREIANEEHKAGISDLSHFAYPTYARAARTRRENLMRSVEELKEQLGEAKARLEDAQAELAKVQGLEGREKGLDRSDFAAKLPMIDGMLGLRAVQA
jgi:flagellar protein FliJ